jgi:hypothetical protein
MMGVAYQARCYHVRLSLPYFIVSFNKTQKKTMITTNIDVQVSPDIKGLTASAAFFLP